MPVNINARKRKLISFSWREGKYFDAWSVVHTLTGSIVGVIGFILPLSFQGALVITITGLILYEWFEAYLGIGEILENRAIDIVLGTGGFIFAYNYSAAHFSNGDATVAFIVLLPIITVLSYFGWLAKRKRLREGGF